MKTRHVDCPRSATIVFRFCLKFWRFSHEASYADSRTLYGLGCHHSSDRLRRRPSVGGYPPYSLSLRRKRRIEDNAPYHFIRGEADAATCVPFGFDFVEASLRRLRLLRRIFLGTTSVYRFNQLSFLPFIKSLSLSSKDIISPSKSVHIISFLRR